MNIQKRLAKRMREQAYLFTDNFSALPGVEYSNGRDRFKFIDNGGKILLVAHTDSVVEKPNLFINDRIIACPTLDNRIGVYLVCHELALRGVKADILLTEGEETCSSTAAIFSIERDYNWIGEFDRMGYDCALYQYDDAFTREAVRRHGYNPVHGSYTDICELESMGIKAFNFGVAYNDYHSVNSFIRLSDLATLIEMFVSFYREFKDTRMPHTPLPKTRGTYGLTRKSYGWEDYDAEDWEMWAGRGKGTGSTTGTYSGNASNSATWKDPSRADLKDVTQSADDFAMCEHCKTVKHLHDLDYDYEVDTVICDDCYTKVYGVSTTHRFEKFMHTNITVCDDCGEPDVTVKERQVYSTKGNFCDSCYKWYVDGDIAESMTTRVEQSLALIEDKKGVTE